MINAQFQRTSLKYSTLLLIGLIVEWWIIFYSPLNLPERIPGTPIKISAVSLFVVFLTVFIKAEKEYLRINSNASILELSALGTIICLLAEIVFQLIRQPFVGATTVSEHLYYFSIGVGGVTVFCAYMYPFL